MSKQVSRTMRVTFKDTPEGHAQRDSTISRIINAMRAGTEQEGLLSILEGGITFHLERMSKQGDTNNKWVVQQLAIREKLAELRERDRVWAELDELWGALSAKEFEQWCADKDIDFNSFLEWRETKTNYTEQEKARDFLKIQLRDGTAISTQVIKQRAIAEGIIEDTEMGWNYLRATAVRQGYTGKKKGYWQNGVDHEDSF